jgi:hypothetical protein
MNGVALFLFLIIYTIVMTSLIAPVTKFFDWPQDTGFLYISTFLFSLLGAGLAWLFIGLKRLSPKIQRYINTGLFIIFPLMLSFTYIVFGLHATVMLCFMLLQVFFILFITGLPLIFTYGILKKMKIALVASSFGLICIFFLTLLVPKSEHRLFITPDEPWLFIVLFIGYLAFFELATTTLFFSLTLETIDAQKKGIEPALVRFSKVLNSYITHFVMAMTVCAVFTGGIVLFTGLFVSAYPPNVMGIDLGSLSGILLSVAVTVISVLLFWFFSPMKQSQKQPGPLNKKESP